jgi:hypothetical protein
MNNQEPELNPKPDETDSAKTNESIQRERSELPVHQKSYLRSRQIALKKFSPQGGDGQCNGLSVSPEEDSPDSTPQARALRSKQTGSRGR